MDRCFVKLWGQDAGVLLWDQTSESAIFQYTPEFVETGLQISPLKMPLGKEPFQFPDLIARSEKSTFWGLPGTFADSLPEKYGNKLMKEWLDRKGIEFNQLNPIDRLCYVGKRGMGALEFEPAADLISNSEEEVEIDEMIEIARQILKEANEKSHSFSTNENLMDQLITISTSAGGAKAKAIIAAEEDSNGKFTKIYSGQAEPRSNLSYWLLKFANFENDEHWSDTDTGRLEYAYYLMAKACKIQMTECRLLEDSNGVGHFMTKRFDRVAGQKIHMSTFCGIAHQDRNPVGLVSYETLFQTCRDLKLGEDRILQLYRRMVFNILARNQDDHTKNHSFLMFDDGTWDLSPAYDLCYSYDPKSRFIALQQMMCNKKRDNFTKNDLLETARAANIDSTVADSIISDVKTVIGSWEEFAGKAGLQEKQTSAIRSAMRTI